jgi:hypothetical protein
VDREVLLVKFRYSHDVTPPSSGSAPPIQITDSLIIAIEGLSTGGAVMLLSPACSTSLTSRVLSDKGNANLIDTVHSEFPHIFDDLLLDWTVPRNFLMELGSGHQPAWRVTLVVEEKKKVAGIPATRPILKIAIEIGAADSARAGDSLRKAIFTGFGRLERGWTVTSTDVEL